MKKTLSDLSTVTREEAERLGYSALTTSYYAYEREYLDNTIRDLKRGQRDFVLVRTNGTGVEVWRKGKAA